MKAANGLLGVAKARGQRTGEAGHSLIDLLGAAALAVTIGAMAAPHVAAHRDAVHAAAAARHLAALAHGTRAWAMRHGTHTALVFRTDEAGITYAAFIDGNRDGVRTADIARAVDRQVTPWDSLGHHFPRTAFGILAGATDPESGATLSGSPLKIGGSGILSFGPDGTVTSGTLYVRGPGPQQYALRFLGATGRTRLLRFDPATRAWAAP